MDIVTIETPSLGDRSYVVTDGEVAAVIDPQRDIDRVLEVVARLGVTITHVFETHVHNDYVSGGYELARQVGAAYCLNSADEMFFDFTGVQDGDELQVGTLHVRVMATPGHTPTHLSYVVSDGEQSAVFTGGSLLYGTVGRTDLISRAAAEELTRKQFASARRLATELDPDTTVLPTHGFGSFCSSSAADEQSSHVDPKLGVETSTIAEQREVNLALTITDEEQFVRDLLGGLDSYPRYYAHMGPRNKVGPDAVDLSPPVAADATELAQRIHAGEWVVDLRARTAYAADHVVGTVNVEAGNSFITYLAWIIPWGVPVTLVGDSPEEVADAQRQMARVGIDRPAAQAIGDVDDFGRGLDRRSYRVVDFGSLAEAVATGQSVHVLDVRRRDEHTEHAIAGAQHIPIHDLVRRVDEVPADREVWVHCAGGYRASIAASLLDRAGRRPVLIDDEYPRAAELGITLEAVNA